MSGSPTRNRVCDHGRGTRPARASAPTFQSAVVQSCRRSPRAAWFRKGRQSPSGKSSRTSTRERRSSGSCCGDRAGDWALTGRTRSAGRRARRRHWSSGMRNGLVRAFTARPLQSAGMVCIRSIAPTIIAACAPSVIVRTPGAEASCGGRRRPESADHHLVLEPHGGRGHRRRGPAWGNGARWALTLGGAS